MISVPEIQYITRDCQEYSHSEQARILCSKGIKWVQLRMKHHSEEEILEEAKRVKAFANKYKSIFIINDSISIAKKIGAHGVHLGLKDTPIDKAREILGNNYIIGGTANSPEEVEQQIARGADYVGVGPFRFTTTKENLSPVLGIEGYKKLIAYLKPKNYNIPLVAVGGITTEDIPDIKSCGMNGIAISSALWEVYKPKK